MNYWLHLLLPTHNQLNKAGITSTYSVILRVSTLKYMQLIKLHTTIPTHSQLHQAGITSTYSFQSKYLKVHATALNYTNPQPTTPSYTYLLWFTFKYINYFPESTLVLAVFSYINPHSTMAIYTQLHRSSLNNTGTILNNTEWYLPTLNINLQTVLTFSNANRTTLNSHSRLFTTYSNRSF